MGNAYRSVLALKPTGDAVPANVLAGKTFSNADGTGKIGTMVNNGTVSVTLTDQDPTYTIPEGYHNGSGVVGFSASGGDGADLIVTCDPVFAGSNITCTDGTNTFTETCPSSSPYEVTFQSIPVGIWTISGSYSGTTITTTFTVLDFEAALNAVPEGSTVTPTDDIQTWLHCANIWDKNYTTISQVLADASTLQTLIASNNASDYLARSSTWASDITSNSSAMTYIGSNDYCSDKLLLNPTWLSAICDSIYFESVLNIKVPTMTSNTTPSGVASASSSSSSNLNPFRAFDNNDSTSWVSTEGSYSNAYVQYEFSDPMVIKKLEYLIRNATDSHAVNLTLKGSNDGISWTELKTTSETATSMRSKQSYPVQNSVKYKYYRLIFSTYTYVTTDNHYYASCVTLQLYGRT